MKISVVTISFNQGEYLRACIDSVLNQNYPDLEYIVVDPGSKDDSRAIIDSYGDRIIRVYEKDDGPSDGLNKGFAHATGEVLAFINADDELLPNSLQRMADEFKRQPDADLVMGCGYFSDEKGKRGKRILPSRLTPWLYVNGGVTLFQQGTFFRQNIFRKIGGFKKANRTSWDAELFLDMALAGAKFVRIEDDIALFRMYPGSITGSGRLQKLYEADNLRMFKAVMGREPRPVDRLLNKVARVMKFAADPGYALRRMR
ncbi:glycosyltransferase [Variovorax sp. PAMC28562]|uniref:glycosyltransferase family 2 protein n=1 Tax=Variovorax sp. PAMC28562 TaxID=2762323 RepID=UPI00164E2307|nr:glycosyltransferase family 2 protein [Variovorax sp. PAMC28562]QNK74323.1 glycosyltransferase [Variovorax sp. PAMC28562]